MARHLRVQYAGAIYHIAVRGNARQAIFVDDRDRQRFIERLGEDVTTHGVRLYLCCLMSNHVHLVAETPQGNLSRCMHDLLTAYSIYFNLRHQRSGHLLQGPYKAKLVEGDAYLLALTRYVHLNPVFTEATKKLPPAERIKMLRAYAWSTYRSYIGRAKPWEFVAYAPILAQMPGRRRHWRQGYRQYVEAGLAETDEEFLEALRASPRSIGSASFRDWVDELYGQLSAKQAHAEDVAFRKTRRRLDASQVLETVGRECGGGPAAILRRGRDCTLRAVAAKMLSRYAGLTQREVAARLGLRTGAAVSCQLRKLRELEGQGGRGRGLRQTLGKIERSLNALTASAHEV